MHFGYKNKSLLLSYISYIIWPAVHSAFPCNDTSICVENFRLGSECVNGACTNPFQGGCLRNILGDEGNEFYRLRTCNSEDPEDDIDVICSPQDPDLEYMEVRILSQNWESAFFGAWIVQIMLSEMLGIPATIETSSPDANVNFYHPQNTFQYGKSNEFDVMREATIHDGDCTKADKSKDNYKACAHYIPEVWMGLHINTIRKMYSEGIIESPEPMGAVGQLSWFVPKFVLERDPLIVHFSGLVGERNRRKLARMFKRPTSWEDYCREVSTSNCTMPDAIAQRGPKNENEKSKYFSDGLYIGHFRATSENDCDANPTTCTGHITEWPCDWSSNVYQQTYHNKIALTPSGSGIDYEGYSYSQLIQIYDAANATKSNLIMYWWTPDTLYSKYLHTNAEFTKISLPPPTQTCIDARTDLTARCPCRHIDDNKKDVNNNTKNNSEVTSPDDPNTTGSCTFDPVIKQGKPEGACDDEPQALIKLIASIVRKNKYEVDEAIRSPAYDILKSFTISTFQLEEIIDYLLEAKIDKFGFGPRDAVCRWMAENVEDLKRFIPRSYPRVIHHQNETVFVRVAVASGSFATILIFQSALYTYFNRKRKVLQYAQVEFLFMLLAGLGMVSIGSIFTALEHSDATCIIAVWLITLGYTLELVPLIVKVSAINQLLAGAKKFKRVKIDRNKLFIRVFFVSFLVAIFLLLWTLLDPQKKSVHFLVPPDGEHGKHSGVTIVDKYYYCHSRSKTWKYMSAFWHCILLVSATVLAYQTRQIKQCFNESQVLALMAYSHFIFVVLRLITTILQNTNALEIVSSRYLSLIYSLDTVVTILIYFVPKFMTSDDDIHGNRLRNTLVWKVGSSLTKRVSVVTQKPFGFLSNTAKKQRSTSINGACFTASTGLNSIDAMDVSKPLSNIELKNYHTYDKNRSNNEETKMMEDEQFSNHLIRPETLTTTDEAIEEISPLTDETNEANTTDEEKGLNNNVGFTEKHLSTGTQRSKSESNVCCKLGDCKNGFDGMKRFNTETNITVNETTQINCEQLYGIRQRRKTTADERCYGQATSCNNAAYQEIKMKDEYTIVTKKSSCEDTGSRKEVERYPPFPSSSSLILK